MFIRVGLRSLFWFGPSRKQSANNTVDARMTQLPGAEKSSLLVDLAPKAPSPGLQHLAEIRFNADIKHIRKTRELAHYRLRSSTLKWTTHNLLQALSAPPPGLRDLQALVLLSLSFVVAITITTVHIVSIANIIIRTTITMNISITATIIIVINIIIISITIFHYYYISITTRPCSPAGGRRSRPTRTWETNMLFPPICIYIYIYVYTRTGVISTSGTPQVEQKHRNKNTG